MNYTIRIDESRCVRCGTCAEECQLHLPVQRVGEAAAGGLAASLECIGCLHCHAVCPQGAISVDLGGESVPLAGGADTERLVRLLAGRRSCRRFQDRPVDAGILYTLAQAAAHVPSGGNSHSHRLTILTDGEQRRNLERRLERVYRGRRRLLANPVLRVIGSLFANPQMRAFIRDRTYLRRIFFLLNRFAAGEDPVFYWAPAIIFVHSRALIPTPREDSILAAYNIVLTAETLGMGSCFVSLAQNAINSSPVLKKIIGLEQREQVHAVVVLGHPAVRFPRSVPRKPLDGVVLSVNGHNPAAGTRGSSGMIREGL
jgi:nitroreductase/NAD-dependent dihydropyrimidine dehydrogenase PreA subunit